MKQTISPLLGIGLIIIALNIMIERFITRIPDWIAIPILLVAIVLIIIGGLKAKVIK
ncbi:hypothetical protein [Caloranaerobacter sp. TR13]|uniref:hypothetical protein n=1 Tax=Caloranaerobacter sp. TR13 TaxID=1302151 RepID=UPI0013791EF9|nr:hypothetical protein [Caloranaerobacter sp. TR13]